MSHSLRAKLSSLRYKGILEDKDYKRLCKALDNEKVLDKIRDEIEKLEPFDSLDDYSDAIKDVLEVIDRYTK